MRKQTFVSAFVVVLALSAGQVNASMVFVADDLGRVGRFDTNTNTGVALGNLSSSFSIGQVIGIAYDSVSDSVLIHDRFAPGGGSRVYKMNAQTGASSLLFSKSINFQGGAVVGGVLYGIDENTQTIEAFSIPGGTDQNLTAAAPVGHHRHALGVDASTGQLYTQNWNSGQIFKVNANGSLGASVVNSGLLEDLDFFGGDFLAVNYGSTVLKINGITGATSTFLNSSQVSAMGVTSSLSGIAVASATAVPEPATMALLGLTSLCGIGLRLRRNRKAQDTQAAA